MIDRLLILVFSPAQANFQDFLEIARAVQVISPNIAINIVTPHDIYDVIPRPKRNLPTLTVGIGIGLGRFVPSRGAVLQAQRISKLDQFARFRSLGIDTPETERFHIGTVYDETRWGEFVILKPLSLAMSSSGAGVRLIRTRRLREITRPADLAALTGSDAPMLVQSFIDTGENATHWRVLTLLGRALYSMKFWCPVPRAALGSDDAAIESAIVETKHPDLKKKYQMHDMRELAVDPAILEFAIQVSGAFPNIPLQGIDVVQDVNSKKLNVLEINGGGNVWHFSSPRGELGRLGGITREDRITQFGAWNVAADALVDATMRLAS